MKQKRSLHNCAKGFTLVELLVASFISLLVLALTLATVIANKRVFQLDVARTSLNQNIRAVMDILGANVREAGENLGAGFPAVEIINGADGAPDRLILRRNLVDEVLKLCQAISAGTSNTDVYFATSGTEAGCSYSDNQNNYNSWRNFRLAEGGSTQAYAFNFSTRQGEFFPYLSEQDGGSSLYLQTTAGAWLYDYPVGPAAVYLLEEWAFQMVGDVLQLVINGDGDNPLNIADQLQSFQVEVIMQDGSSRNSFGVTDNWTQIRGIEILIEGITTVAGENITAQQNMRFYPRNILSN